MTDNNQPTGSGTQPAGGSPPATPAGTGAAGDGAPKAPAAAVAKLTELKSDKEFVGRYLKGDPEARAQFKTALAAAHPPPPPPPKPTTIAEDDLVSLERRGFPDRNSDAGREMVEMLEGRKPVSAELRSQALAKKAQLFRDRAFAERYLNGGTEERRTMLTLNVLLSSKVAETA